MAVVVDHAVINVLESMDDAVARFVALGFAPTARGHHSLGSINHLMVLQNDYLELVGIERGAQKVRREIADSPLGLNGLVFGTDDARALHQRLLAEGVPVSAPVDFDRPVEIDGEMRIAAFTTVRVAQEHLPAGRVYFCEHKTPSLVWQPQWQSHPNGARALAALVVVVPDPREQATRLARLLGIEVDVDAGAGAGGTAGSAGMAIEVVVGEMVVRFLTLGQYRDRYGVLGCSDSLDPGPTGGANSGSPSPDMRAVVSRGASPRRAFMGALAIRVDSLDPVGACLDSPAAAGILHERRADAIVIGAASAFDCTLEFVR